MAEVDLSKILYKRLALKGTTLRARDEPYQRRLLDAFEADVLPLMKGEGNGGVQVSVHDVISWERVREAHEMMEVRPALPPSWSSPSRRMLTRRFAPCARRPTKTAARSS